MQRFIRQLVVTVMVVTGQAWANQAASAGTAVLPQNFYQLAGPQEVAPIPLEILSGDPAEVSLRFGEPQIERALIELRGETFEHVVLPSEGSQLTAGMPDLPRVTRMVIIAPRGNVDARLVSSNSRTELLTHRVAPKESLEPASALDDVPLSDVYQQDEFWPPQVVQISEPMVFRDVRFVILVVNPVQYNPHTGELRVYESIDLSIEDIGGSGINERETDPVSLTPGFKKLYSTFINFEYSALDELPVIPGNQLFICQNNATVISKVNELVTWRKKKGIDASVVTVNVTGNTPAQIRSYINTQYTNSNGQLEFVTLIGDADVAGTYYIPTDGDPNYPYGELDNFYGQMGTGPNPDPLPDIGIGRLPVEDQPQLNAMVAKSIAYEATPFMGDTTWYTRTWCAVHPLHIPSNPSTKEFTRQVMIQRGMNPGEMTQFADAVVPSVLEQRVNPGVSVVNHRLSWGNSEMNPPDLDGLANGSMLPFAAVITCGMGWYNVWESVTEEWVRRGTASNPVGAIGAMGMCGNSTRVAENNIVDGGAMYGLFVKDVREQSLVMLNGKLELFRNFWDEVSETSVEEFSAWCNLMGDAAVPLRIAVPQTIVASFTNLANRYTNNVPVQVTHAGQPVEGALVGLYKSPNVFTRAYTDANGNVNLSASLADTGWVYLTITGTDLKTIQDSIHVVNAAATLALSDATIDDDNTGGTQGNGDGVLNPGEIADLNIVLINRGTSATATGINGTLAASEPIVQIVNGSSSYPNIAVGATASPSSLYRVQAGAVQNGEPTALYLTVTSSAGTQVVRVNVTPVAGDVGVNTTAFNDGNSLLDPGDTGPLRVTIQNNGARVLTNASGILRSLHPQVSVTDSVGAFGAVAIGVTAENSGDPFGVNATLATYGGLAAVMELVITDQDGFRDSVEFVQIVGVPTTTAPTGPDAYGYSAYDNTETQPAGTASQYDWFDIATLGTNFGFDDQVEDGDDTDVIPLPFDFGFYGNTFDSVTVCINGWLAFGDHSSMFDFRNWHIMSPMGPPNMVAAYWDDLATSNGGAVYYYYDASEQRFIVQWNVETLWTDVPEVFQVVLYNPAAYPSPTGDGKILVQYQDVTQDQNPGQFDMPYATVGIQNNNHSIGLEYSCVNVLAQNAAQLVDGRAVMFTTASSGTTLSTLTVLSPDGGEDLFIDSSMTIGWFQGAVGGTVRIDISRSGVNGPWASVTNSAPNTGFFDWTVTGPSSSNCFVRVISNSDPDESDTSDAAFSIGEFTLLLNESFEGAANGWTVDSAGGAWVSDWHNSTERALTGTHSYKCGNSGTDVYRASNDAYLIAPELSNLPANATLQFSQQFETEISGLYPDSAYDGGVIEYSQNGGAWTELVPTGGYNKTLRYFANQANTVPATGPMLGRRCFGGLQETWSSVTADLNAFAGSNLRLRFRFGSDLVNGREGWYVDGVQVFALDVTSPPPATLTIAASGTDIILRWADAGYQTYRVYSATNSDGPFDVLEGSTSATTLTIVNGASVSKKFYYVTGE